jgi:hypothetical protein
MALLAPLPTAFDTVLGTVSGIIGRCLLVTAWGHLPTHLCGVVSGRLIVGGVLGVTPRGSSIVLSKKLLYPSYRRLCPQQLGSAPGCPGGVDNEPGAHRAIPSATIAGPRTRSLPRVMAPILSWMAPHRALVDSFLLELSRELSLFDTSEHTPPAAWP